MKVIDRIRDARDVPRFCSRCGQPILVADRELLVATALEVPAAVVALNRVLAALWRQWDRR